MTIVEKVIKILETDGSATLSKNYNALPKHTINLKGECI